MVDESKIVFDTQALLSLYLGEKGAEKVANFLGSVLEGRMKGFISIINLAELYYVLCRRDRRMAEEKERNLRSYNVKVVPVDDDSLWRKAVILKTENALSLADAFAAATAMSLEARLIVGSDTEFGRIKDLATERIE